MTREFGATAWGHAWLRLIEPVAITGGPDRDLPRARALARRGISELAVVGGQVTASIVERGRSHAVALAIPAWTDDEQQRVAQTIEGAGEEGAGDPPDRLVAELTRAGVAVAPSMDAVVATGDAGPPARRHVLAVLYALVQKIDEAPLLAVRLRSTEADFKHDEQRKEAGLVAIGDIDPRRFYTKTTPSRHTP